MPLPAPLPGVITLLNSISAFSTAKIEALLNKLTKKDQDDLAAGLDMVATKVYGSSLFGLAFSYWGLPSQAWLLLELKVVGALTENPPGVWGLKDRIPALLDQAAGMQTQDLLDELSRRLSGKRIIAALSGAQNDTKRQAALLTWNSAAFTSPKAHRSDKFCYMIHGLHRDTNIGLASAPKPRRLCSDQPGCLDRKRHRDVQERAILP